MEKQYESLNASAAINKFDMTPLNQNIPMSVKNQNLKFNKQVPMNESAMKSNSKIGIASKLSNKNKTNQLFNNTQQMHK